MSCDCDELFNRIGRMIFFVAAGACIGLFGFMAFQGLQAEINSQLIDCWAYMNSTGADHC